MSITWNCMLKSRHIAYPREQLPGQYKNKQLFPTTSSHTHTYIYFWKLNQTVLELDLWADKFCSSLNGIWTHTIDTLQHQSRSLTSSALYHSATSKYKNIYLVLSQDKSNFVQEQRFTEKIYEDNISDMFSHLI